MADLSLRDYENEVDMARIKLAHDLAVLRSPATMSSFTRDLKREAVETKDAVLDQVKSTAQSTAERLIEDLKAKAAANPTATLATGAGIAWRMFRSPPIATMLVGAGLFSLWRTQGRATVPGERRDYFNEGKERLIAQAGELADTARQKAAEAGETVSEKTAQLMGATTEVVSEKAAELMSATSERLEQLRATTGATAQDTASAVQARAAEATRRLRSVSEAGTQRLQDGTDQATRFLHDATDQARAMGAEAARVVPQGEELKDIVLRGIANVALVAAIGVICKKRVAERVD
jgi:hypothetical protein